VPTTLRIALLAGLLALLSNLAVLGFIYLRTHDEAISTLRAQVIEQEAVLSDVRRTGGRTALLDAIEDTLSYADPQTAIGLIDVHGQQEIGNLAAVPQGGFEEGYRVALVRLRGDATPREAGVAMHRLASREWLVSGRIAGEGFALRDTLERSLIIATLFALALGTACGVILARYVGRRISDIVTVTNSITARDMSERVPLTGAGDAFDRLSRQINEMLDRIGSLMGELRMLTDALAHDLRSPVSRLRAAAHAAAETAEPAERDRQLTKLVQQSDALMRILTTVLEISRSEALTGRNQFAWFDVGALAAELVEMYEPVAEEAGAALVLDRPSRAIPLYGHRQLLAQAVSNLIENAIRYGASGGEIALRIDATSGGADVAVADRGPGIPSELRSEARRRFGRLDSSRSAEGAGLGLALAEAIAHLHGGQLALEDNAPGLVTIIHLPLTGGDSAAHAPPL
jgi:signal transduction histidine kinase